MLDAGCWMLDAGCWMLGAGCWMLDAKKVFLLYSPVKYFLNEFSSLSRIAYPESRFKFQDL